jgi:competence protein ComEC
MANQAYFLVVLPKPQAYRFHAGMEQITEQTREKSFYFHAQPAVACLAFLAGGIGLCEHVPRLPWVWLVVSAGMILVGVWPRGLIADVAMAAALMGVGLGAAQIERFGFAANHIWSYTTDGDRLAQVEVSVDEPPRIIVPSAKELRALPPKETVTATVRRVETIGGWKAADGRVLLTVEQPNPRLAAGQIVRVTGRLGRPTSPTNPGEFDFAAYCRDQRILATLRVTHADGVTILSDNGPGPINWLREKTRHLLAMGFPARQSFDHAFLRALVLGDSDPQLRDVDSEFVNVGVIYQLSISGLHIAIIGGFVLLICRLLRCTPRVSLITALAVVALYSTVATPSWPGWRAVIMCAAATVGILGRKRPRGLQMLALAACAVLLIHPADLRAPGFQIGFAAVLGMILLAGPMQRAFWNWKLGPDAVVADQPHPMTRWIVSATVASLTAWLCITPLVAYYFQRVNSYSVPASLLLLPVTVLALLGGVMKIIFSLAWPSGSAIWARGAEIPIGWMHHAIDAGNRIPGASVSTPSPSLWMVLAFYALLAAVLIRGNRRWMQWMMRLGPALAIAGLALWPAACRPAVAVAAPSHPRIQITLLDIGAGQCGIIQTAANHAVLVDAGSSTVSDVSDRVLQPYLVSIGCNSIDRILLSHGDFDHISAAAEIFSAYDHPEIFMSPHFERHAVGNIPAESLLDTIRAAGYSPGIIHRGDHLDLGDGATIDVLWPPVDCNMNSNNCGLVLKLHYGGRTVLFPADIQDPPELALLQHPEELKADVLVAPHHGSAELTTGAFIRAVEPQIILASNGAPLTKKQRNFDELATRYPFYRTSRNGAITLSIDSTGQIGLKTYEPTQKESAPPAAD